VEGNPYDDSDWISKHLAFPVAQADATATPYAVAMPDRAIGPAALSSVFNAPRGTAAPINPQPQSLPQGYQQVLRAIMGAQPGADIGKLVAQVPVLGPAMQGGFRAAQALDQGDASGAGLSLLGAVVGGLSPEDAEAGSALGEAASAAKTTRTLAAPFGIHESGSDHPILAPRYEFTNPTTGEPNEIVLAAEDAGRTLRINNVGPVRTDFSTAATDANTLGRNGMRSIARYLAAMHPDAETLVGDRGDGRTASISLDGLRQP
jgi:hypothetical protein